MQNIKPRNISANEKFNPYISVKVAADCANGVFGTVDKGVFTVAASGTHFLYDVEKGDDAFSDLYVIPKDADARACSMKVLVDQEVQISPAILPDGVKVGDKLVSDASGKLVVGEGDLFIEVTEVNAYDKTGVIGVIRAAE